MNILTWLKFKLVLVLMPIQINCKFHKVAIKKKKISLLAAMAANQNQQFGKIGRELRQEHCCKTFLKISAKYLQ